MYTVLILEDHLAQRKALEECTENFIREFSKANSIAQKVNQRKSNHSGDDVEIYGVASLELARAILSEKQIDLILSDLYLQDGLGIELLKEVREKDKKIPFILLTGEPSIESAIEAIRLGANDYLQKPVDLDLLKNKILTQFETLSLRDENKYLRKKINQKERSEQLIGSTGGFREVLDKANQIATLDVTVLIEGESGTGKEMVANLLHENSFREAAPFLKVNCGALSKSLLESELFGAVRGAYTGSDKDRSGYFEAANTGSLFLDEIGEMDLESQVRLLRVLEDKKVTRVGSTKPISVDVRIIAATNKNLIEEVAKGSFREDLYYRLSVFKLRLPPLRERKEDIILLFNTFLVRLNEKYKKSVRGLTPELLSFLQHYSWPGNIRQFYNVLEGMVVLAKEDILTKADLPIEMTISNHSPKANHELSKNILTGYSLEEYEKAIIVENLKLYHNNRALTAKSLGISERSLYRKIKEYNLNT